MGPQVTESTELEIIIETLSKRLDEAAGITARFEHKAMSLLNFEAGNKTLDKPDQSVGSVERNGHLPRLAMLVKMLGELNDTNNRTLEHLSKLI